jgi:hypothetical protein
MKKNLKHSVWIEPVAEKHITSDIIKTKGLGFNMIRLPIVSKNKIQAETNPIAPICDMGTILQAFQRLSIGSLCYKSECRVMAITMLTL